MKDFIGSVGVALGIFAIFAIVAAFAAFFLFMPWIMNFFIYQYDRASEWTCSANHGIMEWKEYPNGNGWGRYCAPSIRDNK